MSLKRYWGHKNQTFCNVKHFPVHLISDPPTWHEPSLKMTHRSHFGLFRQAPDIFLMHFIRKNRKCAWKWKYLDQQSSVLDISDMWWNKMLKSQNDQSRLITTQQTLNLRFQPFCLYNIYKKIENALLSENFWHVSVEWDIWDCTLGMKCEIC